MVKVSRIEAGLNPRNFLGHTVTVELCDVVETERVSKGGGKFTQYALKVVGVVGEYVGDYKVNFLMASDLQELVTAWGEDSTAWNGNRITLTAKEDGKYFRWVIKPEDEKVR